MCETAKGSSMTTSLWTEAITAAPVITRAPVFEPSHYQADIFDFVKHGRGHGMVRGVAGCGKTTTLEHGLKYTDPGSNVAMLAFNRRIARELAGRAPPHVHVSTFHSLGLSNAKLVLGNARVDNRKCSRTLREHLESADFRTELIGRGNESTILRLVSLCKATMQEPRGQTLESLCNQYHMEVDDQDTDIMWGLTQYVYETSRSITTIIDFDDMIDLSARGAVPCQRFDYLFVDECQDLNAAQIEFALKSIKPGGRILAVGDKNQSIYGFRGADIYAIPRIIEALQATCLPLSICYRCPLLHVERAKTLVPEIEAAPWAKEGLILTIDRITFERCVSPGDLVLCRTNAPLVKPCLALIRNGTKAVILGRDIGKGLKAMIRKVQKRTLSPDLNSFLVSLAQYVDREVRKLLLSERLMQAENLRDRHETIMALADGYQTIAQVERRIDTVFAESQAGVTFSTVHKAKGGEAERVFILKPELLPHPRAQFGWELTQEQNIKYVALTRSKNELYFVYGK